MAETTMYEVLLGGVARYRTRDADRAEVERIGLGPGAEIRTFHVDAPTVAVGPQAGGPEVPVRNAVGRTVGWVWSSPCEHGSGDHWWVRVDGYTSPFGHATRELAEQAALDLGRRSEG